MGYHSNVPEQVLVAFVLNRLSIDLANIVLVYNKDGLKWSYNYSALKNINMVNHQVRETFSIQSTMLEVDAIWTRRLEKVKKG